MNRVYNSWHKMDKHKQNALVEKAEKLLNNLDAL
jgi:hypothetical protein